MKTGQRYTKDIGRFEVSLYTQGYPPTLTIRDKKSSNNPAQQTITRVDDESAHDLVYALTSLLKKLE